MNKEEILNKYKESLDILFGDTSNLNLDELDYRREKIRQMQYSNNIVEKSFSSIVITFNREDALMYSMPCLFYRNNKWYKYSGNHPEQIQLNNSSELNNVEVKEPNIIVENTINNIKQRINDIKEDEKLL